MVRKLVAATPIFTASGFHPGVLAGMEALQPEHLAAEATRCDVALEINGYDVLAYPGLVRRLARACALHQTPISVGSDAHNPGQIAQAHTQTGSILREAGITKVRIWQHRVAEEYHF